MLNIIKRAEVFPRFLPLLDSSDGNDYRMLLRKRRIGKQNKENEVKFGC